MASQLLPLGSRAHSPFTVCPANPSIELIDKCVGSRIWVIMKGDKGECYLELVELAAER